MKKPVLVGVMGPTASGKTDFAETLAERLNAQLINADAFQIYLGMDIGTAKPTRKDDYRLLDIRNPSDGFGVGEYVSLALECLQECWELGRSAVVVGGTGLNIRALFEEYDDMAPAPDSSLRLELNQKTLEDMVTELCRVDPGVADRVDLQNRVRVQRALERIYTPKPSVPVRLPPFEKFKYALIREPEETIDRITGRVEGMVRSGWVNEVRSLMAEGYKDTDPGFRAIGYRAIWRHLKGEVDLKEAVATTIAETRQYAKRQRTWLRSEPNLVELELGSAMAHAERDLSGYIF